MKNNRDINKYCTFLAGFFPPMQPIMTMDYLGLKRLTAAFGLITFMKGPAAIFGPPLAGYIYEGTKSYPLSNVFAGGLFCVGALAQTLIPWCHRSTFFPGTDEILVTEHEQFIKDKNG
ncbi:hypothetical protein KUTeg_013025 [Tegillarca granosa]|uniref:Uncharacterized protein n=1 Tax=Tegillarca granosa TaxID=220873 RepID=A0ABQ9ESH3_TEGGR|nr:hypothetical protein KUTeg_013025 [Tegillarca granosa]